MKRIAEKILALLLLPLILCSSGAKAETQRSQELSHLPESQAVSVDAIDGLGEGFIMGADVSSLLSLEASGRRFYGFDGREQDLLKTLHEAGVNYIRVRVWNDPFDAVGNGYGGGNCTVDTAIALGKRAAAYDMGLLVDFHYSDFWADPGKQQAPKAWQAMRYEEKSAVVYNFTAESIRSIQNSGVDIGMVQIGNETTNGFCGETEAEKSRALMRTAAKAVRGADPGIQIVTHFTNPEKGLLPDYARELQTYGVDYDIFSTSFYPEYHGTVENLKEQLEAVHDLSGKRVMIAETSWAYTSTITGAYKRNVQGQADEIADCIRMMNELGDYAVGLFYWEPAWIDVPGVTEQEKSEKREACGAGWASRYAGEYDPEDAGQFYGATACIPTALFSPEGRPLDSLRTFLYVRQGASYAPENRLADPSFEEGGAAWTIDEAKAGTTGISADAADARGGSGSLHFWSDETVAFTAEQTVKGLDAGAYAFCLSVQGECAQGAAELTIYAISGGERYEQRFALDGWRSWKVPLLEHIPCGGEITVGVSVSAPAGSWGSIDCAELIREPRTYCRGDADGNGAISILDATVIQRRLAALPTGAFDEEAADIRGGGTDILDATLIQRYLAGFENRYQVGALALY